MQEQKKGDEMVLKIPTEIYSRVCGYYRPVDNWNPGKQQEFRDRAYYDLKKAGFEDAKLDPEMIMGKKPADRKFREKALILMNHAAPMPA
jgi:ribonucleoside-triphosphate reductase